MPVGVSHSGRSQSQMNFRGQVLTVKQVKTSVAEDDDDDEGGRRSLGLGRAARAAAVRGRPCEAPGQAEGSWAMRPWDM